MTPRNGRPHAVADLRAVLHHQSLGKGTGLGLATVYGIVADSGGTIAVESAPGAGTGFQLWCPSAATRWRTDPRPRTSPDFTGLATILLVEDEEAVRELTGRVLEEQGYRVLAASCVAEVRAKPWPLGNNPIWNQ